MGASEDAQNLPIRSHDLDELAASGALCTECGGVCVPDVETAITLHHAARHAGVEIPRCTCVDRCPVCKPFHTAITALAEKERTNE